ncbi:MAG: KUP/HAK/KT family potassium transporter [Flavobacteriia bacterium]
MKSETYSPNNLSLAGLLITLGIIYGDIGTSPLYVFNAIIGNKTITETIVLGGLSCVFWTLVLITTFKYVYLAIMADNQGEGGIFALYALVRSHKAKWPIIAALIGCSALIADGFITPPISISSAIEGLSIIFPDLPTLPIVVSILILLFAFQQFGTSIVGGVFGPVMLVWFSTIALLGCNQVLKNPDVLKAFNPYYAYDLLVNYPKGYWILGAVFLCTTGAEALYADLGHCGKKNIRLSWIFVLFCLLLNYAGQSAWALDHIGQKLNSSGVFYSLVPDSLLPYVIVIATAAAVIASQALISGCFTLVNEASKLRLWINHKVQYPAHSKGQVYIGPVNWFLMIGCLSVLVIFKEAKNMEAAYGLSITINMLMTSMLLLLFFYRQKVPIWILVVLGVIFFFTELSFFFSNVLKFFYGGWFTFIMAIVIFTTMYLFHRARDFRNQHFKKEDLVDYAEMFGEIIADSSIPKVATNLVFMAKGGEDGKIDSNIIYSIFHHKPKRADIYWFVSVDILDNPQSNEKLYSVKTIVPGKVFYVHLQVGFKVKYTVSNLFRKVVQEMEENEEVNEISRFNSLKEHDIHADFKYMFVKSMVPSENELRPLNKLAMSTYARLQRISYPVHEEFGLDTSNVEVETVPMNSKLDPDLQLRRI